MKFVLITFAILFLTSLGVIHFVKKWLEGRRGMSRSQLVEKLQGFSLAAEAEEEVSLTRKRKALSDVPFLNKVLSRQSWVSRVQRLIEQAGVGYTPGSVLLGAGVLAALGILVGLLLRFGTLPSVALGLALSSIPFVLLRITKDRRIRAFQRQLPEALDLISRALRAGHAFTSGMKLAAENFKEPLGSEFTKTVAEVNFGTSVAEALKNLATRVDCPDLRFFVVAVILQRETGGNLAEIMENMSNIIRERFAFEEKVQALTSEGRLSSKIVAVLVLGVAGMMYVINPHHFDPLLANPIGRILAIAAVGSLIGGIFVMNRMTNSVKL